MVQSWLPSLSFKINLKITSFRISINSPGLYLSPECLLTFFSKFYIPPCAGNFQIYGVHIPRKCIDSRYFTHVPRQSKPAPKFLSSRPRQKEITHSLRQHSFENMFPLTAKRGGRNYNLLYQNSVRKYDNDFEH